MNTEQMRIEFEDWWEQFKGEHEEWMWADKEALLFQAWQAALQAKSVPVARSLDFEAMHTPFGIHATPQQADKVRELEAKYNELLMTASRNYPNETRNKTATRYINGADFRAGPDNKQSMKGE